MESFRSEVYETLQRCFLKVKLPMQKAIFLDRDGTINEEVNYLKKISDIRIFPGAVKALQKFKYLGYLNIVITNQSGVARGFLSEEQLNYIHSELKNILTSSGECLIDDIFYSPYHAEGIIDKYKIQSPDRKPGTGMISKACSKHNIDLQESYFIGDSFTDMLCAQNAGLKKILVKTGYGAADLIKCADNNLSVEYTADDLLDAADFIEKSFQNV